MDNPKDIAGADKAPLALIPGAAMVIVAAALAEGAAKYGPYNWREKEIQAATYIGAAERHMRAWFDGEDKDPHSGVHHIGHAIAGLMILLDAELCGSFVDNRPTNAPTGKLILDYKR